MKATKQPLPFNLCVGGAALGMLLAAGSLFAADAPVKAPAKVVPAKTAPVATAPAKTAPSAAAPSSAAPKEVSKTEVSKEMKAPAKLTVDSSIASYKKSSKAVSGTIKSVGSDTMNELMALWAEHFKKQYPNVQIEAEGKGSATAPPALIAGTAMFGPMSREMKSKGEEDEFEKKFGYKPTSFRTSIDMLAIYVHKDNPLKGLTLAQADAIFSKNRNRGGAKELVTWGDLGLEGEWKDKPISLYGRNAASGTYGYFKEHVLSKGDYKDTVKEQPGSSAVVQSVAGDKFAMGYSGIGYKTSDVRAVALASEGTKYIEAEAANAYSGDYPLSRYLFIYINKKPGTELDPLRAEFIKFMISHEGQSDVLEAGYLPLPGKIAEKTLTSLGLSGAAMPKK